MPVTKQKLFGVGGGFLNLSGIMQLLCIQTFDLACSRCMEGVNRCQYGQQRNHARGRRRALQSGKAGLEVRAPRGTRRAIYRAHVTGSETPRAQVLEYGLPATLRQSLGRQ
eukprot:scaffold12734_cov101-Isochrysis_galbana.AAC.1